MRKYLLWLICLGSVFILISARPPELCPQDVCSKIKEILSVHATYHSLDQELIKRSFINYLQEIDPLYSYLLASEIKKWLEPSEAFLNQTLEDYKSQKFLAFEELHQIMVKAIHRRRDIEKFLDKITPPEDVDFKEFKNISWAKTIKDLENRLLRIKGLQLKSAEKILEKDKNFFLDQLKKKRTSKEEELISSNLASQKQLILCYTLKAITSALDSNTMYFTPHEANQFMIQVQQRLFGIGAKLKDDLNGFSIVQILDNSPLSQFSEVKIGDRIVAINHEPVIGLDLTEAVELIRGPAGTDVTITFARKNEQKEDYIFNVKITRNEIVLKESRLDPSYEPYGDGIIGILKLFSFYQDNRYSSSTDLLEAIQKLKKEHLLKGLVLDLRNNAGGLLPQAVAVSSLFMNKGVVVSVKDNTGYIQRLRNTVSNPIWTGPLVILVDRTTASAAEIVAQTLQEYGRAIIVGDEQTYGKGTFQTFTLDPSYTNQINPKGEYKVTRGKYYTVSGKTPQCVGVKADIIVPGIFSEMEIGEKFTKFPLEPDQIPPSFHDDLSDIPIAYRQQALYLYKFDLQQILTTYKPFLERLQKNSIERLTLNKTYQVFLDKIKKQDFSNISSSEQIDFQLNEGINIIKDLIFMIENIPCQAA